jgi:hypothetical protein
MKEDMFTQNRMEVPKYLYFKFVFLAILMVSFFYPDDRAQAQRAYGREEEEIRLFTLRELSGDLEFRFEYEDDQEEGLGRPFQRRETRFEERLDLKTRGSLYHPNFLEFHLNTSFGLRQQLFSGELSDHKYTFPYEYNINLNFLREKPYSFNLFANRSSNPIGRTFFETIDVESDSYGGTFRYQNKLFPMTFLLLNQSTKEDSRDFKRDRTERTADFRVSNKLEDILGSEFRYVYKDLIEEIPSKQEISSHDFSLNSRLDYNKVHGNSNISYLKTSGFLPTDQLRVNENFHIDHSKTFSTLYNYNFSRFVTESFRSNVNQGSFGFRHKLYESLITEIREEISWTGGTDLKEFFHGPSASLSYRKSVPGGALSAGYNFLYRKTDREAEAGIIRIFGERIVLSDAQRTFLANPNVNLSSVIVRDTFGVLLTLNVDYRLISGGSLTEIQRVGLPDNTLVLVDYDYSSPRSLKYDTYNHVANLRYDFQRLFSLYYNYINTRQKEISARRISDTTTPLYDTEKSLYGAELRWRWFNFVGEYEDDKSDLNPYTAVRVRGNFNISPTDYSLLGLSANHSQTEYGKDRRAVTVNNIQATLNIRLNSFLDAMLEAGYLKEKGRDIDTRALRFKGNLKSRFRSIELKLQPEYLRRHEMTQDRNEFIIKFNLIRYFDIL